MSDVPDPAVSPSEVSHPAVSHPAVSEPEPAPAVSERLRDDPDFRRYWVARIASLSGSLITAVAMPVLVYRLTASPFLTALTTTLGVRSMSLIGMLQSIAGAGFMALVVVWCDRVLGIGTSGWRFGLLFSVWGVGGILASVVMPRLLRRTTPAGLTLAAIPVSAAAGLGVALARHWAVATAVMVVWGLAYQLVIIAALTYRQQETPEPLLSRVNTAGRMLSWGVGWTLGSLVAGALAEQVGTRSAMLVMVASGVVAAVFAWLSPLRGLRGRAVLPASHHVPGEGVGPGQGHGAG